MVAVQPFRALRYSQKAGDLSRVLAPPYDVIHPQMQEALYAASLHNAVRLTLAKQEDSDTESNNRYTRAAQDYISWQKMGILSRDPEASFTVIEHSFEADGKQQCRLGFMALLSLEDETDSQVIRHEATLAEPKADRQRLLDAVPANLSPIFCVYPDAKRQAQEILETFVEEVPETNKTVVGGEALRLWIVSDKDWIVRLQALLAGSPVLIADGHHRFEVARANRRRCGAVMAYFVSMEDAGLKVRPIHRVISPGSPPDTKALEALCQIAPVKDLAALTAWLEEGEGARFGCYAKGKLQKVSVRSERLASWQQAPSIAPVLAKLDVSILQHLLLPSVGIQQERISYLADTARALEIVDSGKAAMAWLLNGIPIEQVYAISSQGLKFEAKSTFFYPKVLTGIAFNPFDGVSPALKNASTH